MTANPRATTPPNTTTLVIYLPVWLSNKRQILRTTLLILSIAIPIAFIGFVDQERQRTGITPFTAVGGLVALSLVIAAAVVATRR